MSAGQAERIVWFARARSALGWTWLALAIVLVMLAIAGLLDNVDRRIEIAALLFAAIIGLPHGAVDHRVGREVFAGASARTWMMKFSVSYLGIATFAALVWWWWPALAFIAFLAVSVIHFGAGDVLDEPSSSNASWHGHYFLDALVAGAVTVLVPFAFFPEEVATLFGWITLTPATLWLAFGESLVFKWTLVAALVVWSASKLIPAAGGARAPRRPPLVLEVLIVTALFATVRPLLAFALYFALLHAPRHTLVLAAQLRHGERWRDVAWVLVQSLPLTLLSLLGGAALCFWLAPALPNVSSASDSESTIAVVRVVFWLLAALTFPHMWLTWRWQRLQARGVC